MVDRYYHWFFDNYQNYKYQGQRSKAVFASIKEFIAKNDPNIYNFNTIYSSFLALYKGNIISEVRSEGIFPLKGNYYLIFEEDDTLVPLAYIEFYKRVSEIEIENIVRVEMKKREIYYDSLIGQKEVLVNKCDRLIRNTGNHTQEVKDAKINRLLYLLLLSIPGIPMGLVFSEKVVSFLHISSMEKWVIFGVSILFALVLFTLALGFFEDVKILSRGKKINQDLYDIELKLHTNQKKVQETNVRKTVQAIKGGKKITGRIVDIDYKEQYYASEDRMEAIEKDKLIKTKVKFAIYHISGGIGMFFIALIASFIFINFKASLYRFHVYLYLPILSSLAIAGILLFPLYKIKKNISLPALLIRFVISGGCAILLWFLLLNI